MKAIYLSVRFSQRVKFKTFVIDSIQLINFNSESEILNNNFYKSNVIDYSVVHKPKEALCNNKDRPNKNLNLIKEENRFIKNIYLNKENKNICLLEINSEILTVINKLKEEYKVVPIEFYS